MKHHFTIRHGALDGVEAFLSVAQHRSFRRAAADLGVTPSAISQAIRGLEARIGAALFARTTRSVGLTEAGERFLSRAAPAYEELVAARATARSLGARPMGLLRLSVPRGAVSLILQPVIASFCEAYPEVDLEISATEELVDLVAGGFDAGIRLGQFLEADMVALRLTPPFPFVVVGAPAYFERRGVPQRIKDLQDHACLRLRGSDGAIAPWRFLEDGRPIEIGVKGRLIANDYPTLVAAAQEGVGLAQVPEPMAYAPAAAGRLRTALTTLSPLIPGVFLYHPGRRQVLPKLRAFIDHITRLQSQGLFAPALLDERRRQMGLGAKSEIATNAARAVQRANGSARRAAVGGGSGDRERRDVAARRRGRER
jgi:DNA-binding transcriptional LysR family regulator